MSAGTLRVLPKHKSTQAASITTYSERNPTGPRSLGMDQRVVADIAPAIVETDIPARLDRLPWSRFHTLVVAALGITWLLDGLEVTLAGSIAGALQESPVLHFTAAEVGLVGSAYLVGAVIGAVLFGYLADRV